MSDIERNLLLLRQKPETAVFLDEIMSLGPSLILGGAVRDWINGKPYRDVDITVDCPPSDLAWLGKYQAEKNRFNGYYLIIGGVEFDIWSVQTTWAFKKDKTLPIDIVTIPKTVFLTMDAVGYRLDTKEVIDAGFKQTFETKQLDIVFEPNPFPFLCVSRALLGLVKYDLEPAPNLKRYIDEQVARGYNKKSFDSFVEMRKLKGNFDEAMERVSHGL